MISAKNAAAILIFMCGAVIVYQLLVVFSVIPYEAAWGGRLQSHSQMVVFETISLLVLGFLLVTVMMWRRFFAWSLPENFLKVILWVFIVIFLLNTIGNLFAENFYERLIATPLTLLAAVLLFQLVRQR